MFIKHIRKFSIILKLKRRKILWESDRTDAKKKKQKKTEQHIEVTHIFLANNMVNQITPYTVLRYLYNHNKILINKKMHIIITPLLEITNQNQIFHSMNYLIIHRDFKRRRKK